MIHIRNKALKVVLIVLVALAVLTAAIFGFNWWLNRTFITTFYNVSTDKQVEDLRIVLLSDLHLSEFGEDNIELVDRITSLEPDIIAVAGDMNIDENDDYSVVTTLMKQLVDVAPVYYAPGNHEWAGMWAHGSRQIEFDLKDIGVHWMSEAYETVEINGNSVMIGGFFEWPGSTLEREGSKRVADDMNGLTNDLSDVYTVLICHCPEVLYTSLEDYQFDLVLSGHAHGGQVRIGSQGLWSTSQGWLPEYTSGVQELGHSQVVISRGLGDSEPYPRIFNQPEVVVVDVNY